MAAIGRQLAGWGIAKRLYTWCGVGLLAAVVSLSGCMIPNYQLPHGFSSSYQRQLYGMEPVPPDPYSQGLTAIETHAGIFYPTAASHEPAFTSQPVTQAKKVEPMHLPPEPRPKPAPLPTIVMAM